MEMVFQGRSDHILGGWFLNKTGHSGSSGIHLAWHAISCVALRAPWYVCGVHPAYPHPANLLGCLNPLGIQLGPDPPNLHNSVEHITF